jgi:hypothetical protein
MFAVLVYDSRDTTSVVLFLCTLPILLLLAGTDRAASRS